MSDIPGLRWYCAACDYSVLIENRANHEVGNKHLRNVARDTSAPVAQPLSAEEEAKLRRDIADSPDSDVGFAVFGGPEDAEETVARLLATLDAARSVPDNAALREAVDGAAMTVEAMDIDREMPGETLTPRDRAVFARARRLAVERIRHSIAPGGGSVEVDVERLREIYGRIFAALAAAPASPAGLDVERLAIALRAWRGDYGLPLAADLPDAADLAQHYADAVKADKPRTFDQYALSSPKEASSDA